MKSALAEIETPALLLDEARMMRNIARMQTRMDELGVRLRPHAKTSKCLKVVKRQIAAGATAPASSRMTRCCSTSPLPLPKKKAMVRA